VLRATAGYVAACLRRARRFALPAAKQRASCHFPALNLGGRSPTASVLRRILVAVGRVGDGFRLYSSPAPVLPRHIAAFAGRHLATHSKPLHHYYRVHRSLYWPFSLLLSTFIHFLAICGLRRQTRTLWRYAERRRGARHSNGGRAGTRSRQTPGARRHWPGNAAGTRVPLLP